MRTNALISIIVLGVSSAAIAQSGDMKGMDGMKMDHKSMPGNDKSQTTHKATGVVKRVDRNKGTATVAHDPVKSMKWPAMTMSFTVKDKSMLDRLPANKKVDFEFVQQGKEYVITDVK